MINEKIEKPMLYAQSQKEKFVLPTANKRCNISSKGSVLSGRNDAEVGPVNFSHVST